MINDNVTVMNRPPHLEPEASTLTSPFHHFTYPKNEDGEKQETVVGSLFQLQVGKSKCLFWIIISC